MHDGPHSVWWQHKEQCYSWLLWHIDADSSSSFSTSPAHLLGLPLAWPLPQSLLQPPSPCLQTPPLCLTPPLPLMLCIFVKDRFKLYERGTGAFTGLVCLQLSNYMSADLVVGFLVGSLEWSLESQCFELARKRHISTSNIYTFIMNCENPFFKDITWLCFWCSGAQVVELDSIWPKLCGHLLIS